MKKIKYLIIVILLAFMSFSFYSIPSAMAQLSNSDVKLSDPKGGNILPGGPNLNAENIQESFIFSKLIPFVITYTIRLAIALAVIALIYGGYQYITAFGKEEKYKIAQQTIIYALIGLVLAITAFGIVQIITSLKFT